MITSDNLFRLFYLIHLAAILEPETQVRGVVVVLDFENLGMRQIAALNPSFSMKLLTFIQVRTEPSEVQYSVFKSSNNLNSLALCLYSLECMLCSCGQTRWQFSTFWSEEMCKVKYTNIYAFLFHFRFSTLTVYFRMKTTMS